MRRTWGLRKTIKLSRHEKGREGEAAAATWLQDRGYRIESKNYRCRMGELDLVAWQRGTLVFVEVKTRGPDSLAGPAEAVNARKRARIIQAARHYLLRFASQPPDCRFDVIEVTAALQGSLAIHHLPDAFRPDWP